ncbi:ABC transporter ATP-binding protein [Roseburia hominis]
MCKLRLENISYSYKKTNAFVLEHVSYSFEEGKLYALIGPSGCGKTTLLSIIAGLERPSGGEVYLDGVPISSLDLDEYRRKKVTMIFQMFHLFPLLTALENVSYPMEMSGIPLKEAYRRAKELLRTVNLSDDKENRFPGQLSGGEQQRVAIARALSTSATVLLADEPTGNLDGDNSAMIIDLLSRLAHEQGYCVIVVTHDPVIAKKADEVFEIEKL